MGPFETDSSALSANLTVLGQAGEELGSAVSFVGDIDLDGLADLTLTSLISNRVYVCWSSQLGETRHDRCRAVSDYDRPK